MNAKRMKAAALALALAIPAVRLPAHPAAGDGNPAKRLVIKIGSIAPGGSPWDEALQRIAAEWDKISSGAVELKIYAGTMGDDAETLRKMNLGLLQGGAFTNMGMVKVNPNLFVLNTPFLIGTREEYEHLAAAMADEFVRPVEEAGYKVLFTSLSGWVYLFSKESILYPEDLKKARIAFTATQPEMENAFKAMGYQIVPNDARDLIMALQSRMADAIYHPALLAAAGQYFPLVPHMLPIPVSIFQGWVVLNAETWASVPEDWRGPMTAAVEAIAAGLYEKTEALEKSAVEQMIGHGLKIVSLPEDAPERWRSAALKAMGETLGDNYSRSIFARALELLGRFRAGHER